LKESNKMNNPLKKIKESYTSLTGKSKSVEINDIFPGQPQHARQDNRELDNKYTIDIGEEQTLRPLTTKEKIANKLFDISQITNYWR